MKTLLLLLFLSTYQPAPIVEPIAVPFDPNVGRVIYAQKYDVNDTAGVRIYVSDDANGVVGYCSEGTIELNTVTDVNGVYEHEFLYSTIVNEGLTYVFVDCNDIEGLNDNGVLVLYGTGEGVNLPPVITSVVSIIFETSGWKRPTSVSDPNNTWSNNGTNTIDGDEDTYSVSSLVGNPLVYNCIDNTKCRIKIRSVSRTWLIETPTEIIHNGLLDAGWHEFEYNQTDSIKVLQTGGSNNGSIYELQIWSD